MMKITLKLLLFTLLFTLCSLLLSCGGSRIPEQSPGHITATPDIFQKTVLRQNSIPAPLIKEAFLPEPENVVNEEVYTIVVYEVPIRELLFALARDAKINMDIDNQIKNTVTLNAIDQTLPQILDRLTTDNALFYEIKGDVVKIRRDLPFLKIYSIDYLNISRNSSSEVNVATEISSTGQGAGTEGSSGGSGNSNSKTVLNNISNNNFWTSLEQNIHFILNTGNTDRISSSSNVNSSANSATSNNTSSSNSSQNSSASSVMANQSAQNSESLPAIGSVATGSATSSANVTVNKETGLIAVNATRKKHREIQHFIDQVTLSAKRQVMIEATIAEVQLGDQYQAGIDWSSVQTSVSGVTMNQNLLGETLSATPVFALSLTNNSLKNPLRLTLKALEEFGQVKVLSSPKIMVLNNQTALLKVVDNLVYFTVNVDIEAATATAPRAVVFETEVHTVPIGFVMAVTAFVNETNHITLNIRPTISRQIGSVVDPNPALAEENVQSLIPVIQIREIESILQVNDGDTAVLGGLMQNETTKKSSGIPFLSAVPMLGHLFSVKDDSYKKSELVIFIKPSVIKTASLDKDLKNWKKYLPAEDNPHQTLPPISNPWNREIEAFQQSATSLKKNQTPLNEVE